MKWVRDTVTDVHSDARPALAVSSDHNSVRSCYTSLSVTHCICHTCGMGLSLVLHVVCVTGAWMYRATQPAVYTACVPVGEACVHRSRVSVTSLTHTLACWIGLWLHSWLLLVRITVIAAYIATHAVACRSVGLCVCLSVNKTRK